MMKFIGKLLSYSFLILALLAGLAFAGLTASGRRVYLRWNQESSLQGSSGSAKREDGKGMVSWVYLGDSALELHIYKRK